MGNISNRSISNKKQDNVKTLQTPHASSPSSSASSPPRSTLPERVREKLRREWEYGAAHGELFLSGLHSGINDSMIPEICDWITKLDGSIRLLYLGGNKITSKGAIILFDFLKSSSSTITAINLNANPVDDECIPSLGGYIQCSTTLLAVYLGYSKVTNKGIELLSQYLVNNTSLESLDFQWLQELNDDGVPFLMQIARRSKITKMYLNRTSVSDQNIMEINEVLRSPADLREITLDSPTKSAAKVS